MAPAQVFFAALLMMAATVCMSTLADGAAARRPLWSTADVCEATGLVCDHQAEYLSVTRDFSIATVNDLQHDFFLEPALVKGGRMVLDSSLKDPIPRREFLSARAAAVLPALTTDNLQQLLRRFNVAGNTKMARSMATSAFLCGNDALPGEARACPTSAQAMGEFVAAQLGSREVELLATSGAPKSAPALKEPVIIGNVQKGSLAQGAKVVVCHNIWFPTQAFYCHTVTGTKLIKVDLLQAGSDASTSRGVAICHLDTTLWASTHPAFRALNIARGAEACHFLVENDVVFVPAASHPATVEV